MMGTCSCCILISFFVLALVEKKLTRKDEVQSNKHKIINFFVTFGTGCLGNIWTVMLAPQTPQTTVFVLLWCRASWPGGGANGLTSGDGGGWCGVYWAKNSVVWSKSAISIAATFDFTESKLGSILFPSVTPEDRRQVESQLTMARYFTILEIG